MNDLDAVTQHILTPGRHARADERSTRMGRGMYRLDYGDDDQVFVMTVTKVRRRKLPLAQPMVIGELDGVAARLTGIVVDTHLHVQLDVAESPRRDELLARYEAEFAAWEPTAGALPPAQPGDRLNQVVVRIDDELGTDYHWVRGQSGGTGTEWLAVKSFLPVPPTGARRLTLRLGLEDQPEVAASFDL